MLYQTLNQPYLLLIYLTVGFCCGFIFDVGNFIKFLCANKKFSNFILDIVQTSICLILSYKTNLKINYGEIRLIYVILIILAFLCQRLIIGKIVAKFYFKCYNTFERVKKKIWRKTKDDQTNKTN